MEGGLQTEQHHPKVKRHTEQSNLRSLLTYAERTGISKLS